MFAGLGRGIAYHRRALFTLAALVVGVYVLVNGAFWAVSRYPKTCLMCHYMDPYYEQWQASTHYDVSCIKCHDLGFSYITVNGLKYLTGNYNTRPTADVGDNSCLSGGCHEQRLIEGTIEFRDRTLFNHADHLKTLRRGKRLRCSSCHGQMVQGTHMAVTERVCYLCHFMGADEGKAFPGCPSCHGVPDKAVGHDEFAFACNPFAKAGVECHHCHVKVAEGDGAVSEDKCFWCHVGRSESYSDPVLVHSIHVQEQGIDCFLCHDDIRHGDVRMVSVLEGACESCHEHLHSPQKEMYIGAGGSGVQGVPSRMFAAGVTCDGCHTHPVTIGAEEFGEHSLEAERTSCVTCHGEGYDLMLDDWLSAVGDAVDRVGAELDETWRAAGSQRNDEEINALLDDARHNHNLVKEGRGAHNVDYAIRVLKRALDVIDEARARLVRPLSPVLRNELLGTSDGYCMILCHQRLGVPEQLTFERMEFPHSFHSDELELECTICHSPDKHKSRVITRSQCMECHHSDAELECSTCHYRQHDLYTGNIVELGREGDPDFMAIAEIECLGCHDPTDERTPFDQASEACLACHEEGYEESLVEWINEGQRLAAELRLVEERLREVLQGRDARRRLGADAQRMLEATTQLRIFLEKAQPAHNSMFAQELFEEAIAEIEGLLAKAED
jgi:hypothetical protein